MSQKILNYRMFGNGHPVFFLHGFLESITMWNVLQLESFPFQVILIDLPGHGKSKNEDDHDPSITFMAEKVIELADHLEISTFSLVGHSMGGYVALELKNKWKDRCDKVVLMNSNFWEDSDSKKKDRLRVAEIVFKNKSHFIREAIPNLFVRKENFPSEISALISEALEMDKHGISYASLAMRNRGNTKKVIQNYPKDFLIIQGALDTIVPMDKMKEELGSINIQVEVIDKVGHMSHFEATESVKNNLLKFL